MANFLYELFWRQKKLKLASMLEYAERRAKVRQKKNESRKFKKRTENFKILQKEVICTGCPKKVEKRFNFLSTENKHAV